MPEMRSDDMLAALGRLGASLCLGQINAESDSTDRVRRSTLTNTQNDRGSIALPGHPYPETPPTQDTLNLICDELYGRIPNDPFDPQTGSRVLGHQYRASIPRAGRSLARILVRQRSASQAKPRRMGLPLERPTIRRWCA